jgi:hypothetical protein
MPCTTWNHWGLRGDFFALLFTPCQLDASVYHDVRVWAREYDKTSDTLTFANISHKSAQVCRIDLYTLHNFTRRLILRNNARVQSFLSCYTTREPRKPSHKELFQQILFKRLKNGNPFVKTAVFLTKKKTRCKINQLESEEGNWSEPKSSSFLRKNWASSLVAGIPAQFRLMTHPPSALLPKLPPAFVLFSKQPQSGVCGFCVLYFLFHSTFARLAARLDIKLLRAGLIKSRTHYTNMQSWCCCLIMQKRLVARCKPLNMTKTQTHRHFH